MIRNPRNTFLIAFIPSTCLHHILQPKSYPFRTFMLPFHRFAGPLSLKTPYLTKIANRKDLARKRPNTFLFAFISSTCLQHILQPKSYPFRAFMLPLHRFAGPLSLKTPYLARIANRKDLARKRPNTLLIALVPSTCLHHVLQPNS